MPEINPLTNDQIFLKKIAENTGSDYETGDVSEINPLTIDQIFLKEIAANTAGQSGDITELEEKVTANTEAIEAIVGVNGCCNILDNNQPGETTTDITWTVNADKTVTASSSGQSVSGLEHHVINNSYTLQPGTYRLSGGVDSNNYIELLETNYDYTGIIDTGNGYEFTVSSTHTYIVLLRSGNGVVNAEFKPMLYDARLNPTGYVPYAMTNEQLTRAVETSITYYEENGTTDSYGQLDVGVNLNRCVGIFVTSHVGAIAVRATVNNVLQIWAVNNSSATADTLKQIHNEAVTVLLAMMQ